MEEVTVYTDGACRGNPGPGGWAAVIIEDGERREISGGCDHTTNNRMELLAAIEALSSLAGRRATAMLHTDSEYLHKGVSEWIRLWKTRGWTTVAKKPVKNADLWKRLDELTTQLDVRWMWVRGHAGVRENERCDALAREQIRRIQKGVQPEAPRSEGAPSGESPAQRTLF